MKPTKMCQMLGHISWKWPQQRNKEIYFGTRTIQTYQGGALSSVLSEIDKYRLDITVQQELR